MAAPGKWIFGIRRKDEQCSECLETHTTGRWINIGGWYEPPERPCLRMGARCLRLQTDRGLRWSSAFTTETEHRARARTRNQNFAVQDKDGVIIGLLVLGEEAWDIGREVIAYVGLGRRALRKARGGRKERECGRAVKCRLWEDQSRSLLCFDDKKRASNGTTLSLPSSSSLASSSSVPGDGWVGWSSLEQSTISRNAEMKLVPPHVNARHLDIYERPNQTRTHSRTRSRTRRPPRDTATITPISVPERSGIGPSSHPGTALGSQWEVNFTMDPQYGGQRRPRVKTGVLRDA